MFLISLLIYITSLICPCISRQNCYNRNRSAQVTSRSMEVPGSESRSDVLRRRLSTPCSIYHSYLLPLRFTRVRTYRYGSRGYHDVVTIFTLTCRPITSRRLGVKIGFIIHARCHACSSR